MKNYNKLFALALAALALAACGEKASIRGTLADGAEKNVIVKQLDINVYRSIDTLKTGKDGSFRYSLDVKKGQPEFIYLFYGDTRIAALLLEAGETAVVKADTLGRYSVEGSKGSADLAVSQVFFHWYYLRYCLISRNYGKRKNTSFFEVRGIVPFRDPRRGGGKVRDFRIDDLEKESASGRAGLQPDVGAIPTGSCCVQIWRARK